jgi:spore germination cell wall hydrolase CwlJ-like protein
VSEKRRFKLSPRVVLVAVAALSALAVDAWMDWKRAREPAEPPPKVEPIDDVARGMDPAMLALARRHDPILREGDFWGRSPGWETLDISAPPDLGFRRADAQTAREVNALKPFAGLPIRPMRPFNLSLKTVDGGRALHCLTQAIYYEAAREPELGQEAVAQVVLNRLRHPAYPKSVCGVVFQGSLRRTGCQFSFTCDGSLAYLPEPGHWARAQRVARRALAGFVMREVGSATHYHADYVAPYWAPTLVKLHQVGAHIFYRWTGPWGEPPAFTGRYSGGEAMLSSAVLQGGDPRTQGGLLAPEQQGVLEGSSFTLAVAGEVRTYSMADRKTGIEKTRVLGRIAPARRQPTPEEVKAINASLAEVEAKLDAKGEPAPPAGGQ